MRARLALAATAGLLAACAPTLKSTLAPPPPAGASVGVPVVVWPVERVEQEYAAFRDTLQRRIVDGDLAVPIQLTQDPDRTLRVRLGADETFAPASAQLLPAALATYATIAGAVAAHPGVVTHVLVHGETGSAEPATDLTARRAASVVHYLATRGLAVARLRGEGRGTAEPYTLGLDGAVMNRRVELVFKPVIAGREAEAWVPPAPIEPCEPCAGR